REAKPAGTPSYMSPEQIRREALDGRSDIYSFACSAYEMVTGRPPLRAASTQDLLDKHLVEKPVSPREFNPQVTKDFAELVLQMLAKKRDDRPRNFHEVMLKMRGMFVFIPPPRKRPPPEAKPEGPRADG